MSNRVLRVRNPVERLRAGVLAIQAEQELRVEFPAAVLAEARRAATAPRLPDIDRTDVPFLTLDPAGAMDLDQAMHLERDGDGYLVRYAIADVGAFVDPGGAIDTEAHRRGETLYGADMVIPLHPPELSEGAASLLPGQVRPAFVWTIRLDASGAQTEAEVVRARVRSVARMDYESAQRAVEAGAAGPVLDLLAEVGRLRLRIEQERGGVSLPMPEQVIDCTEDRWHLEFREVLEVEAWNAQISLLTGFAAAAMMVQARVGILRTLPPPDPRAVARLHHTARALGISWPTGLPYPDFVRSLDPRRPHHEAMVVACTTLLRGAGYAEFNGAVPDQPEHAALAAEYAHVTAPLRRLVDRYGLEICTALCAGDEVPDWVLRPLPGLPATMQRAGHRSGAYEGAVLSLVEAATLADRVGDRFAGVIVETESGDPTRGEVVVREPAVEARVHGSAALPLGEEVELTLVEADPSTRTVRFQL